VSRTKGSKNTQPAKSGHLNARIPDDLEEWLDELDGPNRSAKVVGLLRAARAINLKPYYPDIGATDA
jgi:hypothetical protein